jgi:hypothetical protein
MILVLSVVLLLNVREVRAVKLFQHRQRVAVYVGKVCTDGAEIAFSDFLSYDGSPVNIHDLEDQGADFWADLSDGATIALTKTITLTFHQATWDGFEHSLSQRLHVYAIDILPWTMPLPVGTQVTIFGLDGTLRETPPDQITNGKGHRNFIVSDCSLAAGNTIKIINKIQPNRLVDFNGDLGSFQLNNGATHTISKPPGAYLVSAQTVTGPLPIPWHLIDIDCYPNTNTLISQADGTILINVSGGVHVTCTFVYQRIGLIRSVTYHDINRNGLRDLSEPGLSGWTINLYAANDDNSDLLECLNTNKQGVARFTPVHAGVYTVCQVEQNDWVNTQPRVKETVDEEFCYTFSLAPGEIAHAFFGNAVNSPVTSAAASRPTAGLLIYPAPDTEMTEEGEEMAVADDAWLNTEEPEMTTKVYLPAIHR